MIVYIETMKISSNQLLFFLLPVSFALGLTGPSCSPEEERDTGLNTEVGPDGRVRKIIVQGHYECDFKYNESGILTMLNWDNGDSYACTSTGDKTTNIQINSAYDLRCEYDDDGNITKYIDDQGAIRSSVEVNYNAGFPEQIHQYTEIRQNDGSFDLNDTYLISNIQGDEEGLSSAEICTYNGSSSCFQEYDATITCSAIDNPFYSHSPYSCLLEFNDQIYNITKFSKKCVNKVVLTNKIDNSTYEVSMQWSQDSEGKVNKVILTTPIETTTRLFEWN